MMNEIFAVIIAAIIGGSGMIGLLFHFFKKYLEKKIDVLEGRKKRELKSRIEKTQIDDELSHAYGRLLFWLYKAVVFDIKNGELDAAFNAMQSAEAEKKDWDRKILAEAQNKEK